MGIIWTIVIGFVVGLLAKMLTPGRDPSGFFITAAIGIAGSLLATFSRWQASPGACVRSQVSSPKHRRHA
jgi:uncharacterized membrane protein YeaQ/YmgE (transglycosylase-associated protein family)